MSDDALVARLRDGLLHDTVPFWLRHGLDHEHGGVITCLDRDGAIVDTDKGVWQQGASPGSWPSSTTRSSRGTSGSPRPTARLGS